MELISCKNLSIGYHGIPVQRNLNFSVHAGDYLCIVGENGSGKSTLMKTILHLQAPIDGEIQLKNGLTASELGYLSQQTLMQRDFPATVNEIVLSGCQNRHGLRPFYSREEKSNAKHAMERMDVHLLGRRCFAELSGGQQQRVLLARALCAAKKILLLDEPITGLDPKVTAELYNIIQDLNRKDGMTIIMISHDIDAASIHASHILQLSTQSVFRPNQQVLFRKGGDPSDR